MKWRFQSAKEALTQEASSWDFLNTEAFRSHPLLDTRFVVPLVCHFGTQSTQLATLDDEGRPAGALLLNAGSLGVWRSFLPSQAQLAPVVLSPDRVDSLPTLMEQAPSQCWLLELMRQDRTYSCFRERLPADAQEIFYARTMRVNLNTSFETYWRARPRNLRRHLRNYLKRVRTLDRPVALRLLDSASDVVAGLKRYGDLETQGWKGASGTAVHADNKQGRFYAEVLDRYARSGQAYVYELYFGDQLAASRLCIASDEMLVILKTTYDESLAQFAPGRMLLYELLRSEFHKRRHKVIEFYTNANKATLAWGSETRDISHVTLFRNPWVRRGFVFLSQSKRALRNSPRPVAVVTRGSSGPERSRRSQQYYVEEIRTHAGFHKLRDEWRRLHELDGYNSIFLTHSWFDHFIREVVDEPRIAIYVVRSRENDVANAVFPMMWVDQAISGLSSRTLTFLANFYSPVAKPIFGARRQRSRIALARAFVRHLRESPTQWVTVDFNMLPRESRDFEILQESLAAEGCKYTVYFGSANWILPTAGLTGDQYVENLPSIVRNTIHRRYRRALRAGSVDIHVYTGKSEVIGHIDDYNSVYARSWKRPEPYPQFHRRLIERLAQDGKVIVGVVSFNGTPVAAQIWLFHESVASIVKLCYDERYKEYSFGTILTQHLMKFAIDVKGVARVDYLTGDEEYKRDWMSVRRERWGVVAFNERSIRGRFAALSEVSLKPRLKQLLRQGS